ncbi:hypothetical protein ACOMHN_028210 [Nucella lapillus]
MPVCVYQADVNTRDHEGRTALHLTAVYGNCTVAAILLLHDPCDVNAFDRMGQTAVMLAIENDNQDMARQLAEAARVDILLKDPKDRSCLHLAVTRGQLEVARALLHRNSTNLHSRERTMGRAPIHLACALVCSCAGLVTSNCLFDEDTVTQYHALCTQFNDNARTRPRDRRGKGEKGKGKGGKGKEQEGKSGKGQEGKGKRKERHGEGPRSLASLERLSRQHAIPTVRVPSDDDDAATRTNDSSRQSMAATFMDNLDGNDVESYPATSSDTINGNDPPSPCRTPPRQAGLRAGQRQPSHVAGGSLGVALVRESSQARVGAGHSFSGSLTPLSGSSASRSTDRQSLLSLTPDTPPPLAPRHSSLKRPSTAPALALRRPSPSVSFASPHGPTRATSRVGRHSQASGSLTVVTAANIAIVRYKLVALLLHYGADVNVMTIFRKSPLHIAAIMGTVDVMALLLPRANNVNAVSAAKKTALHLAVEKGYVTIVAQLIVAGANLKLRDMAGMTPLHSAAHLGQADTVTLLLKAHADVNARDFQHRVPLHHAYLQQHPRVAQILTDAGARTDIVDVVGATPLDYNARLSLFHSPKLNFEDFDQLAMLTKDGPDISRKRKVAVIHENNPEDRRLSSRDSADHRKNGLTIIPACLPACLTHCLPA